MKQYTAYKVVIRSEKVSIKITFKASINAGWLTREIHIAEDYLNNSVFRRRLKEGRDGSLQT